MGFHPRDLLPRRHFSSGLRSSTRSPTDRVYAGGAGLDLWDGVVGMQRRLLVTVVAAGLSLAAACGDDSSDAGPRPDPSTKEASPTPAGDAGLVTCSADGSINGAITAAFNKAPAGSVADSDAGGPPAFYQTNDEDVVVAFQAGTEENPASLQVSSSAGEWRSVDDAKVRVSEDGTGASANKVALEGSDGKITVDVKITCA